MEGPEHFGETGYVPLGMITVLAVAMGGRMTAGLDLPPRDLELRSSPNSEIEAVLENTAAHTCL